MKRARRPLRPEIAALIEMLAAAALDHAEADAAAPSNIEAQTADSLARRTNPLPDFSDEAHR